MNFKAILITAWIWFPALATAYDTDRDPFPVCDSPVCNERAKLLHESLNTSIEPCMDFYSYVCSKWASTHPLPSGRGSYDVYQQVAKDIPEKLRYILENRALVENNQTIIDKVKIMYNACFELPDHRDDLITVLNESGYNAWPILNDQNIFNSSNCTDLLRHMSISAILSVELVNMKEYARDPANPYRMVVGPLPVPEEVTKDIGIVINSIITFLNPGISIAILQNLTNELVEFAKNLSEVLHQSSGTKPFPISSLEENFPIIPVSALLKKEFEKVNITLNDTEQVYVHYIYCKKLSVFLETANPNTLYNYAGLLAMVPYIEYVSMSTEEAISNVVTPSATKGRNWRECIDLLHESASEIVDYLYVTSDTNHTAIKYEVEDISLRLRQAFNETLQNNSWIDDTTREALKKKLNRVILGIGYPDTLLNISVLETQYEYVPFFALNISFTEALYYFRENSYKMQLRKFRYPEEGDLSWEHSSRDTRTFHNDYWPKIEIPYALLVSPFFQQGLPRSLNYGGIGVTIAHELLHTFSFEGTDKCQERPRLKCNISDNSFNSFKGLTACFSEEYKAANEKVSEEFSRESTLNEDLADNTGLQTAFKAYNKVLVEECEGQDTRLAGLQSFSGMQLFFISSARAMCRITEKDAPFEMIGREVFSPARNRVNVAMRNLEGFAEAFNCSVGSPMHPTKTCSLW